MTSAEVNAVQANVRIQRDSIDTLHFTFVVGATKAGVQDHLVHEIMYTNSFKYQHTCRIDPCANALEYLHKRNMQVFFRLII